MACLHHETFEYNSILNFSDYVYKDFKKFSQEYPGIDCKLILPSEKIFLENNTQMKNNALRDLLYTHAGHKPLLKNVLCLV